MARPTPQTVDFHYDISCPFAYIASLALPSLAARHSSTLTINYRPVLLGALYRATSAPQGAHGSASDTFNATKKAVTSAGFARTLRRLNMQGRFQQPPKHPMKTTRALRLLYCVERQERIVLTGALYQAYWVNEKDVTEVRVLREVVQGAEGLSEGTRSRLLALLESGEFEGAEQRKALEGTTALALERGAFGVPAFWLHGEERLYWGQDRLQFLEKKLHERTQSSAGMPNLEALVPRCVPLERRRIPEGEEVKMEFWYDFSSPWAFLGWTQLARLQRIFGPRLKIEMKPFLLGILFREIGAPNLPMATVSEAKRNYSVLDHGDWCRWWNDINSQNGSPDKAIEFYWADIFPIRTPTVLKAVLAEPKLVDVLFRACWERNKDMASDTVVRNVIAEAGYDADHILAKANSQEIKQDLRRRTQEAKDTGICGVPSYRVFRRKIGQGEQDWSLTSDIVWGQDETVAVEDWVSGWDGQSSVRQIPKGHDQRGLSKL